MIYCFPVNLGSGGGTVAERIYRYRDFDIEIDVRPLEGAGASPVGRILAGYLCHVRLSGKAGQPDLPSLALLDRGTRLFGEEQDAVIAGCCAGEAAIDTAFMAATRTVAEAVCA